MIDNKKNTKRLGQKLSKNFTYLIMIGNFGTLLIKKLLYSSDFIKIIDIVELKFPNVILYLY